MNTINIFNFGKKVATEVVKPKKQTYDAMYRYSKAINDNASADTFRKLDNHAKTRLHIRKSAVTEQRLLDSSEEMCEEALSPKEIAQYLGEQTKNMLKITKESLLATYYSMRP